MNEYAENGAHLGWLIDPVGRKVHVHVSDGAQWVLDNSGTLPGDPVPPGFVPNLEPIREPTF